MRRLLVASLLTITARSGCLHGGGEVRQVTLSEVAAPERMREIAREWLRGEEHGVQAVLYSSTGPRERSGLVEFELRLVGELPGGSTFLVLIHDGIRADVHKFAGGAALPPVVRFVLRVKEHVAPPGMSAGVEVYQFSSGRSRAFIDLSDVLELSEPGVVQWRVNGEQEQTREGVMGTRIEFKTSTDCRSLVRVSSNIEPAHLGIEHLDGQRRASYLEGEADELVLGEAVLLKKKGGVELVVDANLRPDHFSGQGLSQVVHRKFSLPECVPEGTPVFISLWALAGSIGEIKTVWKTTRANGQFCRCESASYP